MYVTIRWVFIQMTTIQISLCSWAQFARMPAVELVVRNQPVDRYSLKMESHGGALSNLGSHFEAPHLLETAVASCARYHIPDDSIEQETSK